MHLSLHADYALRSLLYLGSHPGEVVSTAHISRAYGISKHHLARVMQRLAENGYVTLTPGRAGGVSLAREPRNIRLGHVIRDAEPHLRLVECFDPKTSTCPITGACGLKSVLARGLEAFLAELNKQTLADLLTSSNSRQLVRILKRSPGPLDSRY